MRKESEESSGSHKETKVEFGTSKGQGKGFHIIRLKKVLALIAWSKDSLFSAVFSTFFRELLIADFSRESHKKTIRYKAK